MEVRVNVSLIGDTQVGKTTIANMINQKSYSNMYQPSIGASMLRIPYQIDNENISFQLWDTAGMEKYRSLAPVYYRDSNFGIIVFDLGSEESFSHIDEWIALYRTYTNEGNPVMLIGNKSDTISEKEREEIKIQAERWAEDNHAQFIITSAKENENIDTILPTIYSMLCDSGRILVRDISKRKLKERKGCC